MCRCSLLLLASLCLAQDKPKALFPVITAVVNGASFQPGIVSGSWATILGTDLATTARSWEPIDFAGDRLPPNLSSTGVVINGKPAYIGYISPNQINALVADDVTVGSVTVLVTEAFNSSNIFLTSKVAFAPALFTPDAKVPVAAHNNDGTLVTPASPARPGEVIQLFGTGFGATNPVIPTGFLFTTPAPLAQSVTATLGQSPAKVEGYLISPGVYQLNLTVPDIAPGDQDVVITINQVNSQAGLRLSVAAQ